MNTDPTKQEMVDYLTEQGFDDYYIEVAIYMFASLWHGGQSSNLYNALSTSDFRPGLMWTHDKEMTEDSGAAMAFEYLEAKFTDNQLDD